jgi:hypothetical protein
LRDAVKASRGADAIRAIADIVIDNDGPMILLRRQLDTLRTGLAWVRRVPRITPVAALQLPADVSAHVSDLVTRISSPGCADLVAVTGSGSRGKYRDGWSDIDILVIADLEHVPQIRLAATHTRDAMPGIKLGLTIVTLAECEAAAVTPRLIHVLRSESSGAAPT